MKPNRFAYKSHPVMPGLANLVGCHKCCLTVFCCTKGPTFGCCHLHGCQNPTAANCCQHSHFSTIYRLQQECLYVVIIAFAYGEFTQHIRISCAKLHHIIWCDVWHSLIIAINGIQHISVVWNITNSLLCVTCRIV